MLAADRAVPGVMSEQFWQAARQVAASEAPPPEPSAPSLVRKLEDLTVSEEHAREVVKFCFWPMARYVDPLWALSDAEAQKATPQMQKFLQWLLLKYVPLFTLKLAARFPELLGVLVAMALVAWHKSQIVMAAQHPTETAGKSQPSPVAVAGEVASREGDVVCELCRKPFATWQALADHLPCNPA